MKKNIIKSFAIYYQIIFIAKQDININNNDNYTTSYNNNSGNNSKLSLFRSSSNSSQKQKESDKKVNNLSDNSFNNNSIEMENNEKINKVFINFENSEESNDEKGEVLSDNIIIGEKEYEDDLSLNLYIEPEIGKDINEEQIPNLYNELLEGIDKNFELNF